MIEDAMERRSGASDGGDRPALLLIPGAFQGAWAWRKVQDRLVPMGWTVRTVELPSVAPKGGPRHGMLDDAAAVRRHLEASDGPVVVVAHSYGGMPVTQAAAGLPQVRHIVYLAGFQLDVGDSLLGVAGEPPPWWIVDGDTIEVDRPVEIFYGDVAPDDAAWTENQLLPSSYTTVTESLTVAAWRNIPSTYVLCEHDQALPPPTQEQMAKRAGDVRRLPSSHSPMLSRPAAVTQLITDVAGAAM
jgi:pimeloyl-ACP methyl ester carboxylesterase